VTNKGFPLKEMLKKVLNYFWVVKIWNPSPDIVGSKVQKSKSKYSQALPRFEN
jgi:hypothetical protein